MAAIMKPFINRHWQDWADLVLGLLILASPWAVGIAELPTPAMNAVIVGLAVAFLSIIALGALEKWEEWLNVGLGAWLMASPWALGYSHLDQATAVHMGLGVLVILMAGSELWQERKGHQV